MHSFSRFLLEAMGLAPLAGVAMVGAVACGGTTILADGAGSGGGNGTTTGSSGGNTTNGNGGAGTTTVSGSGVTVGPTSGVAVGVGVSVSASTTTGTSSSTSTGGCPSVSPPEFLAQGCIALENGTCPGIGTPWLPGMIANQLGICDATSSPFACCGKEGVIGIQCGPALTPAGTCCYEAIVNPTVPCGTGRPFTAEHGANVAGLCSRDDWTFPCTLPKVDGLDAVTRVALAEAWAKDARFEHASVASFARLALELLAVGAPPELVRDAQAAMGDEIRHAQRCFALASAYAAEPVGPGPLALDGAMPRATLVAVAGAAAREGCIGETIAAIAAAEARDRATDPAVRAALASIADEEARHAAMSWRLCAWAWQTGAPDVRAAIAEAFATPEIDMGAMPFPEGASADEMHAHGRLSKGDLDALASRAFLEVVCPSAAALLASDAATA